MADLLPSFQFTTQEDWLWKIPVLNADANGAPLALVDAQGAPRVFEVPLTPARSGATPVQPVATLTTAAGGGVGFEDGFATLAFRVSKATAGGFPRGEFTADILEVVAGERHRFMPVRISYYEPSAFRGLLPRQAGVAYSATRQPVVTTVPIAGARGPGILSAARAPSAGDGLDGDFFINTAASPRLLYGPKAAGTWPTGAPFVAGPADVPGLLDRFTALVGGADGDHDTLGKLATLIEANRAQLAAILAGATPAVDTFIEVYQRFLADESAAAALNTALAGLSAALTAHAARTDNPHAVTKAQVGLGNVDNTADAVKPVSTAQAAAIAALAQRAANLSDLADKAAALAALNGLDRRFLVLAADPGTADVPAGTVRVAKNTSTGRLSLWANDGGAMVDLLLLSTS